MNGDLDVEQQIAAFLAREMNDEEESAFIAYAMDKPHVLDEIEADLLLRRAGLLKDSPFKDLATPPHLRATPAEIGSQITQASFGRRRWPTSLAAGLLCALAISIFINAYQFRVEAPVAPSNNWQANTAVPLAEFRQVRSDEPSTLHLSIDGQAPTLYLKLQVPNVPYYEFNLTVSESNADSPLYVIPGLVTRADGFVSASIPTANLVSGHYVLEISSQRGPEHTYSLHLSKD